MKQKREAADQKKKKVENEVQKLELNYRNLKKDKDLRDSSSSPPATTEKVTEDTTHVNTSSSWSGNGESETSNHQSPKNAAESTTSIESPTAIASPAHFEETSQIKEDHESASNQTPPTKPKISPEDIKDYKDYCNYYNSLVQNGRGLYKGINS